MIALTSFRLCTIALITSFSILLSGCFLSPGKFTSELYLTGDDEFTFTYDGEIFFLGLSQLAQIAEDEQSPPPPSCYDEETLDARECTEEEITENLKEWEANAAERAAESKKQAQQMAVMMGGIDVSDPKAAEELAELLQRQKGWEKVEHLGDGVFKVCYSIIGRMSHDFMFPAIEGFPATNPFVQVFVRKGDQVRINAPGFAAQGSDNMLGTMLGGMGALPGMRMGPDQNESDDRTVSAPPLDGTFTIRTTGSMRILANNTDEGAARTEAGESLTWNVSPRTAQMPTALVDITR